MNTAQLHDLRKPMSRHALINVLAALTHSQPHNSIEGDIVQRAHDRLMDLSKVQEVRASDPPPMFLRSCAS